MILAVDDEARRIPGGVEAGIFVQPENPQELVKVKLELYEDPDLLIEYGPN